MTRTYKRILITGGCGFIGSNLAVRLAGAGHGVVCLDNLSRRGSEILMRRVTAAGCQFVHGDVRNEEDFRKVGDGVDLLIECSAEPSVLVGTRGDDARFMINNNLLSAIHCFEFARRVAAPVLFLSTSRVYPYTALNALRYREEATRFVLDETALGVSAAGVAPGFPLTGARSLYGATKLAAELLLTEYGAQHGLPSIINRCGVVAGPWQLGKVDQGVFTYWLASHCFGSRLSYLGFGGQGKQVRDLLHVDDLGDLVELQIAQIDRYRGEVFHAGGGTVANLSLAETTPLCQELAGRRIEIGSNPVTRPADVIWYMTDFTETERVFGWRPRRNPTTILRDTHEWLLEHEQEFRSVFGA